MRKKLKKNLKKYEDGKATGTVVEFFNKKEKKGTKKQNTNNKNISSHVWCCNSIICVVPLPFQYHGRFWHWVGGGK